MIAGPGTAGARCGDAKGYAARRAVPARRSARGGRARARVGGHRGRGGLCRVRRGRLVCNSGFAIAAGLDGREFVTGPLLDRLTAMVEAARAELDGAAN